MADSAWSKVLGVAVLCAAGVCYQRSIRLAEDALDRTGALDGAVEEAYQAASVFAEILPAGWPRG